MLLDVEFHSKGIAILKATGGDLHAHSLPRLNDLCEMLQQQGKLGIVLELSRLKRVSAGGLAALVELISLRRQQEIVICNAPEKLVQLVETLGLYRGMPLFADLAGALRAPRMKPYQLRGVRALVMCEPVHRGALDQLGPPEMLDSLGKPLIHRVLENLSGYGCRVAYLNPSSDAKRVAAYLSGEKVPDQSQFLVGQELGAGAAELGVVLRRLIDSQIGLEEDLLIVKGDSLNDADLGAFLDRHQTAGADLTILRNQEGSDETMPIEADPWWNPGAVLIRSGCFTQLPSEGCQTLSDLASFARRSRWKTAVYRTDAAQSQADSIQTYQKLLTSLMSEGLEQSPVATRTKSGAWVASGAKVSSSADITGPVYVASGASVARGARLIGPVVIGEGVHVPSKTLIRGSILQPGAVVTDGALIDGKLLSGSLDISITSVELPPDVHSFRSDLAAPPAPLKEERFA